MSTSLSGAACLLVKRKKCGRCPTCPFVSPEAKPSAWWGNPAAEKALWQTPILGMVKPTGGRVLFKGQDVHALSGRGLRELRRDMQMIFQDPFSSLNPRFDVFRLVSEPMLIRGGYTKAEMEQRVLELLELVGAVRRGSPPVSFRFFGRTAAADRDRPGHLPPSGIPGLRRAGIGAGRVGPRADPQPVG